MTPLDEMLTEELDLLPLTAVPLLEMVVLEVCPLMVAVTVRVPSPLSTVVALMLLPELCEIPYADAAIWMAMKTTWMSQKGTKTRLCQGRPLPCSMY